MTISAEPSNDQLRRVAEFRAHDYRGDTTLPHHVDRWADDDPDHPFLSDGVSRFTYGRFREAAWNLAAALHGLGAKISRPYADARVQRIYGGTSEIMREIIARSL
jgi:alkylation response protein AidB-like acyl-CoA dehydrogenase